MDIKHAKTKTILKWFEEINRIPRCSKNEKAISDWLYNWAQQRGLEVKKDKVNNVLIKVAASPGFENAPLAVVQGHTDMVCEKTKDSTHDFNKDPIKSVYENGWLTADRTSLGADNGIAIAMALTLATEDDVAHPPLELLFTVDEETGLNGAVALEEGFVEGKILLNVDSEDEGVFTVGCAGGRDTHLTMPINPDSVPPGYLAFKVVAEGMRGGHSGIDIHEQRANSIKILSRALVTIKQSCDLRLSAINGGTAHNAIPREAEASIFLPADSASSTQATIRALDSTLKQEYSSTDPNLTVSMQAVDSPSKTLSKNETTKVLDLLMVCPHGVSAMSSDIEGLVETSDNMASVKTGSSKIEAFSSQRSSNMNRLNLLTGEIESLGRLAGCQAESSEGYPAWKPDMNSALLAKCKSTYQELFGKEPVIEIIHAGLECGIIGSKYKGMDMISFGPTLKNPHSPDEKIEIESIGKVWDFMIELLKSYK